MYERHGHTRKGERSGTHHTWTNMVARCTNPNRPDYKFYGGRGIEVCQAWRESFAAFLADMGEKPSDIWTLPLCGVHHEEQHKIGEDQFWQKYAIDPLKVAAFLSISTGDFDAGEMIVQCARD